MEESGYCGRGHVEGIFSAASACLFFPLNYLSQLAKQIVLGQPSRLILGLVVVDSKLLCHLFFACVPPGITNRTALEEILNHVMERKFVYLKKKNVELFFDLKSFMVTSVAEPVNFCRSVSHSVFTPRCRLADVSLVLLLPALQSFHCGIYSSQLDNSQSAA